MAFIIKDRVKEGTTTTGTGAITLSGAAATFDTFQSYMTNGDTTYYAIVHTSSGVDEWEVGLGTWNTGNTLTRTTILAGSNGQSVEDFSAGSKDVFMTYPAAHAALAEDDVTFDNITVTGTVDGRDIAADGSKLDGIDTSADVTDATTVAAAGALMKSGGTMTGALILSADPSAALGAATKEYVDTIASAGIHYHTPVRAEHPSNLNATYSNGSSGVGATLTNAGTNAALVIDSVSMVLNDRVLVANQTDQTQNGVYTVTTVGDGSTAWVLTRSTDTDTAAPSDPDSFGKGDAFFIKEGSTNAGHLDVLSTAGTIVFGTTNIVFSEVAETAVYSGGTGVTLTGTTFSIGQAVGTSDSVTFSQVTAAIIGNVTGDVTGDVTGNADTATALETARTIQLTGDVTGSTSFDGSGNVSITAVVQDDSHSHVISNVDGLQTALDAKTPTARTITSGNGLTGGGNLTANRTLNVGAGTGVTVNADTVAIGQDVGTSSNVTFAKVTANVLDANGGSFSSGIDTNSNTGIVLTKGKSILGDDGNYLRNLISWNTSGGIDIGQGSTALVTGINLVAGNAGTVKVDGAEIITAAGSGLTKSGDTLSHSDTSSQASVNNSSGTVIQDITLDTYGHITGIASANLDGRYYTESEADSRFVNVTGDTITSGASTGLTINHNTFGNALVIHRNHSTNAAALTFKNNTGQTGILFANHSDQQPIWRKGTSSTQYRIFNESYHPNADKWTTSRTLSLSGDASGSVSWDGSSNATLSVSNVDAETLDGFNHTDFGATLATYGTTGNSSGRIRITAPFNTNSAHMFQVTISVYSSYTVHTYVVGGYMYPTTNQWHVPQCVYSGSGSPDIVVGRDSSGKAYISIANGNYTGVRVHNMTRGYQTSVADTYDPWTITINGATENSVTPSIHKTWTSGNDGSGSGLDADLLDGVQGSSFLRSDANDTHSGTLTLDVVQVGNELRLPSGSSLTDVTLTGTSDQDTGFNWSGSGAVNYVSNGVLKYNLNNVFHDGYHPNADKWTTARTLSLSGDASGSVSWDGSANATLSVTVNNIDGNTFVNSDNGNPVNADTINSNGVSYYNGGVTNFSGNSTDGALYSQKYSTSWQHQIAGDYRSGQIAVRGKNSGTWTSWNKVWTQGNDGSGSGLDADKLDGYHLSTTRNSANTVPVRNSSGYLNLGWINTTSGNTTSTLTDIYVNTNDGYIRKATPAHFRSQITNGYYSKISGLAYGPWYTTTGTSNGQNNVVATVADDNSWMFISVNVGTYTTGAGTSDNPTVTRYRYRKVYRTFS